MDIRNSVDGLKTLLGVPSPAPAKVQPAKSEETPAASGLAGDHATLSSAGAEVAQASSGSDVRMQKVAAVQAALAAGTYSVPAPAVAGKLIDSMLGGGSGSDSGN
jgi:negative regulator of flagellin synthesis FlgM